MVIIYQHFIIKLIIKFHFGCAKQLVKTEENIAYIYSRNYRPPELVLGATFDTCHADVWSIACVIVELVLNRAIFPW